MLTMAPSSSIPPIQVDPKYLHSNSTSHVWAFGAVAELIDNAYDPDVKASNITIDRQEIGEKACLIFKDNGNGMDSEHLRKMLSLGFCEKEQFSRRNHLSIGHFGNGFKSGSMRLGKDALVFTRHKETAGVGFLSQTYLAAIQAETVVVPLLEYKLPDLTREVSDQSDSCLEAILSHSVFKEEKDLINELKELEKENNETGTKIIIFNLSTLQDGSLELEFDADLKDIRCREVYLKDDDIVEDKDKNKNKISYKRSLREYCSILYLHPKIEITLRGKPVKAKLISKSLSDIKTISYRPKWLQQCKEKHVNKSDDKNKMPSKPKTIQISFGFKQDAEDYGLMMYHRNRLIKAYKKVGCQKQPNGTAVGVIGVVEVNVLQPTHNKQAFGDDVKYKTVIMAFGIRLNDYWKTSPENNDKKQANRGKPKQSIQEKPSQEQEENIQDDTLDASSSPTDADENERSTRKRSSIQVNANTNDTSLEDFQPKAKVAKRTLKKTKAADSLMDCNQSESSLTKEQTKDPLSSEDPIRTSENQVDRTKGKKKPSSVVVAVEKEISQDSIDLPGESSPLNNQPEDAVPCLPIASSEIEEGETNQRNRKEQNTVAIVDEINVQEIIGQSLLTTQQLKDGVSSEELSLPAAASENQVGRTGLRAKKKAIVYTEVEDSNDFRGESSSSNNQLVDAGNSEEVPSTSEHQVGRTNKRGKKKTTTEVLDVEKVNGQDSCRPADVYEEEMKSLKNKLQEIQKNYRKFQENVHTLLSRLTPDQNFGSVDDIDQMVEDMIQLEK